MNDRSQLKNKIFQTKSKSQLFLFEQEQITVRFKAEFLLQKSSKIACLVSSTSKPGKSCQTTKKLHNKSAVLSALEMKKCFCVETRRYFRSLCPLKQTIVREDLQMHFKLHTIFAILLLSRHAMYVYSSFAPSRLSKYCLSISVSMHF